MGNKKLKHFILENQIGEIPPLAEKIDKLAEEWGLPMALAMNINLVIEEAVSNIIFYAFNKGDKKEIKISLSIDNKKLVIEIKDEGIPFDPLSMKQPDTSLPAEDRPVGGLGIFLIKQIMDEMNYKRKKNQNILTLYKNI